MWFIIDPELLIQQSGWVRCFIVRKYLCELISFRMTLKQCLKFTDLLSFGCSFTSKRDKNVMLERRQESTIQTFWSIYCSTELTMVKLVKQIFKSFENLLYQLHHSKLCTAVYTSKSLNWSKKIVDQLRSMPHSDEFRRVIPVFRQKIYENTTTVYLVGGSDSWFKFKALYLEPLPTCDWMECTSVIW